MKKILTLFVCFLYTYSNAQESKQDENVALKSFSNKSCDCIDSLSVYNKSNAEISTDISKCIEKHTESYLIISKTLAKQDASNKDVNVYINIDKNGNDYKQAYFDLERSLMKNCTSIKNKLASNEKQNEKSISKYPFALSLYDKGIDSLKENKFEKALQYFQEAVNIDPEFAFAWDNIGVCNRQLGNYEKAIEAYKKSLEIDPKGTLPLQNIAVTYIYLKDYLNAIKSFEKLAEFDQKNPEIYYGIGQICYQYLMDYEKSLDYMCKAYNLYVSQKSPYRTDAEKIIKFNYTELKRQGKESRFNEILKQNNINFN